MAAFLWATLLTAIPIAPTGAADPSSCQATDRSWRAAEEARLRAHFSGALAVLGGADTTHLTPDQRVARARRIADLEAYAGAGVFPRNLDVDDRRMPTFIDEDGAYCAMAWLLSADGEDELAQLIGATDPHVFVGDLGLDPRLGDWLDRNGLTLAEATRIQPTYGYHATASDCVCDRVLCAYRPEEADFYLYGRLDPAECPTPPVGLDEVSACPEFWPGYPDAPPPVVTQAMLDEIGSDHNLCRDLLAAADPRWAYEVDKNQNGFCQASPGRGGRWPAQPWWVAAALLGARYCVKRVKAARPRNR